MSKIKLNLVSGAVVEKPLITAFQSSDNSYIVLDNEMNGSMGLPIILVSKIENNKLVKIVDQNEWQVVKEYLKNIIAGQTIQFIEVANELSADDIYYTQLTLPVPSFDALKNNYKIGGQVDAPTVEPVAEVPVSEPAPVDEPIPTVAPVTPEPVPAPAPMPEVAPQEPVIQTVEPAVEETTIPEIEIPIVSHMANAAASNPEPAPAIETPVIEPVAAPVVEPVVAPMPQEPVVETPVVESAPVVDTSVLEPTPSVDNPFNKEKEAFMKACENMFDALVQKFQNELNK